MPRTVFGYHGTSTRNAEQICKLGSWVLSENRWDWLGNGVYFWEYGPVRAWEWACETYGDQDAAAAHEQF